MLEEFIKEVVASRDQMSVIDAIKKGTLQETALNLTKVTSEEGIVQRKTAELMKNEMIDCIKLINFRTQPGIAVKFRVLTMESIIS